MTNQPSTTRANEHRIELAGDDQDALLVGLQSVLALANGETANAPVAAHADPNGDADADAEVAVPLQGKGQDMTQLFASLTGDLLEQVETSGGGLTAVRLDGVLQTDDGGVRGWGYLTGAISRPMPPVRCERIAATADESRGVRLRCTPRS